MLFPLPRMECVFDTIGKSRIKYFTSLDLHSAFLQIDMDPDSSHKAAFITQNHGEEHVKKLFSTAVIVNEDTHSNLVRGHCFTGEDTNIFHPWSLKLEGFFRKSTNISFYMVTNLFIYTTGSSHIIDDCSRAVCFFVNL